MCILIDRFEEEEEFTGWKVAVLNKKTGKLYSPATGMLYKIGPVKMIKVSKAMTTYFNHNFNTRDLTKSDHCRFIRKEYFGKTSVFVEKEDALKLLSGLNNWHNKCSENYCFVLIKMTLSGKLWNAVIGRYGYGEMILIAGTIIKDITLLQINN
jgi:hypothetical protein